MLVFPRPILDQLGRGRVRWNRRLLANIEVLEERRYFCDQASLSLAFADAPAPFSELPLEMNFPLKRKIGEMLRLREPLAPVVLHYHRNIDSYGYFQGAPNPLCQLAFERYNDRLWDARQERFDNRSFWNFRYSHAPENGSGPWSRERIGERKRALLKALVAQDRPASVLDVGCGDQQVSSVLPTEGYMGVDIASAVIARNGRLYPERRFACLDFLDPAVTPAAADMVVCLEVLQHQGLAEGYQRLVQRLVGATARVGVVSGFEHAPEEPMDTTFFHEPLSQTLARYGAHSLQPPARYASGITVWRYGVGAAALAPLATAHEPPLKRWRIIQEQAGFDLEQAAFDLEAGHHQLAQQRIDEQQAAVLAEVYNSTSWKITRPLRQLASLIYRLKGSR